MRVQVEVKHVERVGIVFRCEANTESPPIQRGWERDDFLVVKVIKVWRDDDSHSSRGS